MAVRGHLLTLFRFAEKYHDVRYSHQCLRLGNFMHVSGDAERQLLVQLEHSCLPCVSVYAELWAVRSCGGFRLGEQICCVI